MKIIYFDICAVPIFLIILIATFIRKTIKGHANQLFILLVLMSLFAAVSDVIMECSIAAPPLEEKQVIIGYIFGYLYFLTRNATILIYQFFLFAVTRTGMRVQEGWKKFLMSVPYIVVALIILLNPFTRNVFTITTENGYERGPWILLLYIISMSYAVVGTVYICACKRFLETNKWIALISMYVLAYISVIFQFFYPRYLVEMFATAIAFLLVVLIVLRPEELTDPDSGLPSYKAYKLEIEKVIKMKQHVQIVVTRFTNANEVRTYLGEEVYNNYIFKTSEEIRTMLKKHKISYELYYERPGTTYVVIDDPTFDVIGTFMDTDNRIRETNREIEASGVKLNPKICIIQFPGDCRTLEEIIHVGHEFYGLMSRDQLVTQASSIVGLRDYQIESNIVGILNKAIVERKFEMYYQPIYDLKTGKFHSAEALIRLNDKKYGFISPGVFIPAAEGRGLIVPIGDFVLDDVYRFISENNLEELGLSYIEINLSVAQLLQKDLPQKIRNLEKKYGVNSSKVNLEITETMYDTIGDVMDQNLAELYDRGYTFSLDDYGTGYSNIQRVAKLPLSIVKIDKSLVDNMGTLHGLSIMRNTVRMMKDIKLNIVVEGVEREEQLNFLRAMGVDYIQGFYFSKPLPEAEFLQFIREHNNDEKVTF